MSDIMAETMVAEFKRLPQRAYLGGYTSRFGSRTHFQLATFSALMRTGPLIIINYKLQVTSYYSWEFCVSFIVCY